MTKAATINPGPVAAAFTALLAVLLGAMSGCAAHIGHAPVFPVTDTLHAVRGVPLVLATAPAPAGTVNATLDGRALPAWVHRVTLTPRAARGWLAGEPAWSATPPGETADLTFLQIEIPPDAADGVLSAPGFRAHLVVHDAAHPQAHPALRVPPGTAESLGLPAPGATTYWRAALGGASPGVLVGLSPAARAAALSQSATWNTGLSRLERADRWLAGRVLVALTRTAVVSGERVPAWTDDPDGDARLLADLLSASLSDRAVADRARAWLDSQPRMTARVRDPASAGTAAVQITDLAGTFCSATVSNNRQTGPALELGRFSSVLVPAPRGAGSGRTLIASAGNASVSLAAPAGEITAQPPGARLGPFVLDLTRSEWLSRSARPLPDEWAAAALIQRRAHRNSWELYLECKAAAPVVTDRVTLWLGPRGAPGNVLTISAPDAAAPTPPVAPVLATHTLPGRWTALVELPAEAISPDGSLLIGLRREIEGDAMTAGASWPVAMMPWEDEPGRARVDLTRWYDLDAPAP